MKKIFLLLALCLCAHNTLRAQTLEPGAIGSNQTIAAGSVPATIRSIYDPTANQMGVMTYTWQSSTNNSTWTNVGYALSYSPPALYVTTHFRRKVQAGAMIAYSNTVTITVAAALTPGTISGSQTVTLGTTPSTFTNVSSASGGTGPISYRWESSNNGSSWSNISGAYSMTYTPPAPRTVATIYYRRVATSSNQTVYSNVVTISVIMFSSGSISGNQTINSGATPSQLTSTASAVSGRGAPLSYQWQSSTNNSTWYNVSGATSTSYRPGALTTTTYFRRYASDGLDSGYSNTVTVTVNRPLSAGTISGNQTVTSHILPSPITNVTSASGGTGTISYQWQYSNNNSQWYNLSNATGLSYQINLRIGTTTYYRRQARAGSATAYSNVVTITVVPGVNPGSITGAQTISANSTPARIMSYTMASGGIGTITYQWQSSYNNSSWSNIYLATNGSYYQPSSLTSSVYYRRLAISGGDSYPSNVIKVTIRLTGGSISGNQTIEEGSTPAVLQGTSGALGGSGTIYYQWQSSPNGTSWTNISGATSNVSCVLPALTSTTHYRRMVTSDGETAYSNTVTVTVRPRPEPLIPGAISGNQTIEHGAIPSVISNSSSASGGTGIISYQWLSSPDYSSWLPIAGATSVSYQSGPLTSTTYFRRLASTPADSAVYSNTVTITVLPLPVDPMDFEPVAGVVTEHDPRTGGLKTSERLAVLSGSELDDITYVERRYYYDYRGRVVQIAERNHLGGISRYSTKYDFVGNVLASHESHQTSDTATADAKLTTFTYDSRSRLTTETTTLNNSTPVTLTYAYDELGQLTSKTYGNSGVTETYTYNIQGWQTGQASSLFSTTLDYFNAGKYSGNITKWSWGHSANTNQYYTLTYDSVDRLMSAVHSSGSYNETVGSYDKNGNILSLNRVPTGNKTYTYSGNKLTSLSGISGTYTYDSNGNMTTDPRLALKLEYNFLNLTGVVKNTSGTVQAQYRWLADGTKAGVKIPSGSQGFEYLGSLIYQRNGVSSLVLESTGFGGGRINKTSSSYEINYQVSDHLGNVRVMFTSPSSVSARNDYYAFGKRHANSSLPAGNDTKNRFLFNGKENQLTGNLRYLDYGARMYDPEIARWTTVDPLAGDRPWESPFAFTGNNPINRIDTDGRKWVDAQGRSMWDKRGYTKYATADFKRIGIAMRATETGRKVFDNVAGNSSTIQVEISSAAPRSSDGRNRTRGELQINSMWSTGKEIAIDGKMTIYEGSIKEELSEAKPTDETGALVQALPAESAVDGAIGSVAVHEGMHNTQENMWQNVENKQAENNNQPKPHNLEKTPTETQNQYLMELIRNLYNTY